MNLKWYRFCQHSPCATNAASSLLTEHSWPPAKVFQVHAKEHKHDAKIKFLVEIKSALQQRAIATKAEISDIYCPWGWHVSSPLDAARREKYARENFRGQTHHRFSKPTALCPSAFMLQPVPWRNFICTSLLTTGSKIRPNKCPIYHLPVVSWKHPFPPFSHQLIPLTRYFSWRWSFMLSTHFLQSP